jgi:protein tyrosine/serine phosphatase
VTAVHAVPLGDTVTGQLVLGSFTDVGPDPDGALAEGGCDILVSLIQDDEITMRFPAYGDWLRQATDRAIRLPIPDWGVTDDDKLVALIERLVALVRQGTSVLVHCGGGIGRAGVVATLVLVSLGWDLDEAAEHVRTNRPGAGPDSPEQQAQLERLANTVRPAGTP